MRKILELLCYFLTVFFQTYADRFSSIEARAFFKMRANRFGVLSAFPPTRRALEAFGAIFNPEIGILMVICSSLMSPALVRVLRTTTFVGFLFVVLF